MFDILTFGFFNVIILILCFLAICETSLHRGAFFFTSSALMCIILSGLLAFDNTEFSGLTRTTLIIFYLIFGVGLVFFGSRNMIESNELE